jgi:hypothetical protein
MAEAIIACLEAQLGALTLRPSSLNECPDTGKVAALKQQLLDDPALFLER